MTHKVAKPSIANKKEQTQRHATALSHTFFQHLCYIHYKQGIQDETFDKIYDLTPITQ